MITKVTIAIICITILLAIALFKGIDGVLLSSGIALIAGLAGFYAGKKQPPK